MKKIQLINTTPHKVVIQKSDGSTVKIAPSAPIRLKEEIEEVGSIDGIRLVRKIFIPDENSLPEYQEGVFYIVSATVKVAFPERKDFLVPSIPIRDKDGQIIGCKALGV